MLRRFVFLFAVVANLLLVDQVVKAAAVFYLKGQPARVVVDGLFNLAYVENRGCAWGMFQGQVWPLAAFALVAMGVLVWKRAAVFPAGWLGRVAEVLLYAGIVGNLIDRIARGCVVDMFDFHWGVHHFPCFNVADSYITVAATILIALGLLQKRSEPPKAGGADGAA
ncbi:MAG: signal peptidase II [Kiritimatiellia bacterium]